MSQPSDHNRGPHVVHASVELGHFDPSGVQELQRQLSNVSGTHDLMLHVEPENLRPVSSDKTSVSTAFTNDKEGFDFQKTLQDICTNLNEQDVRLRELGVMFENLRVVGLGAKASYQPTFLSTINPLGLVEAIQTARRPPLREILNGFEGVVRPGDMLLVLGRPGSGCSTFLKSVANQRGEYHSVEGEVQYDSFTPSQMAKRYRGDIMYCPEDDIHFPTLTVDQTISFAAKTRAPRTRILGHTRSAYIDMVKGIMTTVFGLRHALATPVGDASIRGISGGEKKRVSISEALATRARLAAWDNSTRGLDASTALEFVRALRIATDIGRMTTLVSIYQAGESLFKLFDKVCLISEGRMVYFGPASEAKQYFIDMGYEPVDRQTTADFLVAVTDPKGRIPRAGMESRVPRTTSEFVAYFQRSPQGQANKEAIRAYRDEFVGKDHMISAFKQSVRAEQAQHTRPGSPYTISIPMQVRAVMLRRVQIIRGSMAIQIIQIGAFVFQAIIIGTVFLKIADSTSAYFSRGGVLFFAILFSALSAMAEIPALFAQRPIVDRHKKAAMYHPFVDSLALTLVDIPVTFVTLVVFALVLYFLVRLQQTPAQFFVFFLFLFVITITMKAFFRTLAAMFKRESGAQAVAGVMVLVLVLYTGYAIPQPTMIGALRWISYINPLRYGFEAILMNEFHTLNGTCASLVPQGPGYETVSLANQVCTALGSLPGNPNVDGNTFALLSYGYTYKHQWRNFGIICAYGVAFIFTLLAFTEINSAIATDTAVTLFKRGSQPQLVKDDVADEEKAGAEPAGASDSEAGTSQKEETMKTQPPMTDIFSWQNLRYTVPLHGGEQRLLLDDISGYVVPGKLTALMGESGAGKTTLLNVLAQRVGTGVVTGDRFVNGQALPADFQAQTGYCQQMDTHLDTTTVREALLFSAKLRQPASVPIAEKEEYVETCLRMCGMEAYADAVVGSLGVEQRKRTTIGVELAAKPKLLLFLDEPTSGLDSQSAWSIMQFLRNLASSGQAILCTIHQPSGELFQVFDRLLLLRKGGQTVYFGDVGRNSTTMINYFERNGARHCDAEENPAEWMLDVIGAGATATTATDWHNVWNHSEEATGITRDLDQIHADGRNRPAVQTTLHSEFSTSWAYQTLVLTQRAFQSHWRNPTYLLAKLVLNIAAGLLIGFTFFKSKDSLQGTQNKLFAVFMGTILSVPLSQQLMVVFINVRDIYEIRERPSRMYGWSALVTSQILVEIPWNILGSSLFFLCWYWTVGFPTERAGYTYFFFGVVFPLYYTTIAEAVAALSPNAIISSLLFSTLFSFVITFNGVLQPFRELGWWQWMNRVSPFTYVIEGILGQAIGVQTISCASTELVTLNPPAGSTCGNYMQPFIAGAGGYLTNPDATSACEFCTYRTTDQFLQAGFNIKYANHWRDLGIVLGVVVFNVFAIYLLTYMRLHVGGVLAALKLRLRGKRQA